MNETMSGFGFRKTEKDSAGNAKVVVTNPDYCLYNNEWEIVGMAIDLNKVVNQIRPRLEFYPSADSIAYRPGETNEALLFEKVSQVRQTEEGVEVTHGNGKTVLRLSEGNLNIQ